MRTGKEKNDDENDKAAPRIEKSLDPKLLKEFKTTIETLKLIVLDEFTRMDKKKLNEAFEKDQPIESFSPKIEYTNNCKILYQYMTQHDGLRNSDLENSDSHKMSLSIETENGVLEEFNGRESIEKEIYKQHRSESILISMKYNFSKRHAKNNRNGLGFSNPRVETRELRSALQELADKAKDILVSQIVSFWNKHRPFWPRIDFANEGFSNEGFTTDGVSNDNGSKKTSMKSNPFFIPTLTSSSKEDDENRLIFVELNLKPNRVENGKPISLEITARLSNFKVVLKPQNKLQILYFTGVR